MTFCLYFPLYKLLLDSAILLPSSHHPQYPTSCSIYTYMEGGCNPKYGIPIQSVILQKSSVPPFSVGLCGRITAVLKSIVVKQLRARALKPSLLSLNLGPATSWLYDLGQFPLRLLNQFPQLYNGDYNSVFLKVVLKIN